MTKITLPTQKSLKECAESLVRKAESSTDHEGYAAMRFSQAAVNVTNAMMNLAALEPQDRKPLVAERPQHYRAK